MNVFNKKSMVILNGLIGLSLACFLFFISQSFIACGETCHPSCSSGFECVSDECVSVCNPTCDSDQTCNPDTAECEDVTDTTDSTDSTDSTDTTTEGALRINEDHYDATVEDTTDEY